MITKYISKIIKTRGIKISAIAEATGISRQTLYRCFSDKSNRELYGDELIKICMFLKVNPLDFAQDKSA